MKHKNHVQGRAWLNPVSHADTGAIAWRVTSGYTTAAELEIRDCNRTVTLDFHCRTDQELEQRIRKLDKIIHACNEIKRGLAEGVPCAQANMAEIREQVRKERKKRQ